MTQSTAVAALSNEALLELADRLEGALAVMNGTAYVPSRKAMKVLRILAKDRVVDFAGHLELTELIRELEYAAQIVCSHPASRIQETIEAISGILAEQG
jgi:hypothetical protein